METKFHCCFHRGTVLTTCLSSKQDQSSPRPPTDFFKMHSNIISHPNLGLLSRLFPSGYSFRIQYYISFPIRTTWGAQWMFLYFIGPIIFIKLLAVQYPPPQTSFPAPCSRTHSVHSLSTWKTKFHSHIKQKAKLEFCIV